MIIRIPKLSHDSVPAPRFQSPEYGTSWKVSTSINANLRVLKYDLTKTASSSVHIFGRNEKPTSTTPNANDVMNAAITPEATHPTRPARLNSTRNIELSKRGSSPTLPSA